MSDLENQLRRALADLDNLRKRFDREMARQRASERANVVSRWLAVLDNLERALDYADSDPASVVGGVRAVRDQAVDVLATLGYSPFDDVGRRFDPSRDEAVGAVPADAEEGTVVSTVSPGYASADGLLRPARVVVSKGPA